MTHERRDADDRVVTPIVRLAKLPEMQSGSEQWPIDLGGELVDAREQGLTTGGDRRRLDDAGGWIGFGEAHESCEAIARHQAVGVEHHHITIARAPAATEIGDVAALALDPELAPAIENAPESPELATKLEPRLAFANARVGVRRIGQHAKVEMPGVGRVRQR